MERLTDYVQSLDSVGAFIGPLLAVVLMIWFAVVPAFIAVGLLVIAVREPDHARRKGEHYVPLTLADAKRLPLRYWLVALLGAVFTLARFSEAFLVLRAQDVGLAIGYVPIVMIVMDVVYAAAAYPSGIASDRFSFSRGGIWGCTLICDWRLQIYSYLTKAK